MLKKFLLISFNFVIILIFGLFPIATPTVSGVANVNICPRKFIEKVKQIVMPIKDVEEQENIEREFVYISGKPIGFSIDGDGVVVVSMGEIKTKTGYEMSPCESAGIKIGDIIKKAEGISVTSGERLIDIINSRDGGLCKLELERDKKLIFIDVLPLFDEISLSYRLGIWVRDSAVGIGTVTYVTQDGGFSALGHPVADVDTSTIIPVGSGDVYKCSVVGVKKGERGEPGELKGLFLKSSNKIGHLNDNDECGITGQFDTEKNAEMFKSGELTEVALPKDVRNGSAKVLTTIDGFTPVWYEIEIIKTNHINNYGNKCMVIRITDKELLSKTNGIVQGMSGSPVVQDGRLIGCITHVFVNDPGKGFADFIDYKKLKK